MARGTQIVTGAGEAGTVGRTGTETDTVRRRTRSETETTTGTETEKGKDRLLVAGPTTATLTNGDCETETEIENGKSIRTIGNNTKGGRIEVIGLETPRLTATATTSTNL